MDYILHGFMPSLSSQVLALIPLEEDPRMFDRFLASYVDLKCSSLVRMCLRIHKFTTSVWAPTYKNI